MIFKDFLDTVSKTTKAINDVTKAVSNVNKLTTDIQNGENMGEIVKDTIDTGMSVNKATKSVNNLIDDTENEQ